MWLGMPTPEHCMNVRAAVDEAADRVARVLAQRVRRHQRGSAMAAIPA